jgi:UDP-N-acetylmuramoylalanine--D-glutamate ligase
MNNNNKKLYAKWLRNKKVLVVGMAKTGLAAAQLLLKAGAKVVVADSNSDKPIVKENAEKLKQMGVTIELGAHTPNTFLNADLIVVSPGVPHTIPPIINAIQNSIPVIGETELAYRVIDIPIIAITGTNGKTTTTELIGDMLKHSGKRVFVGGNIGTPFSELFLSNQVYDIAVLEISSFQLDTIDTFCSNVAILLNITEDHLNRYTDMAQYAESKFKIFMNQQSDHKAILNGLDHYCNDNFSKIPGKIYWLDGDHPQAVYCNKNVIQTPNHSSFDITRSPLTGHHNRQNIAAAILASQFMGGTDDGIQASINTFKGLPHRLEYVDTINGISFYNDSKATNVDASLKALNCFNSPVHLILGGLDKGGDYSRLVPMLKQTVRECILIGQARTIIEKTLKSFKSINHIPIHFSETLEDAVKQAYTRAHVDETILLSPACASFDMFDSYNHRGEIFKQTVYALSKHC